MSDGAPMEAGVRSLVELSAALGGGRPGDRDQALEEAAGRVRQGELARRAVDEALLQAHLFVGYPAALTALARWREIAPPRGAGAEADGPASGAAPGREGGRRERGERLCRRVYGSAYEKLRRNVRRLHPALDRWMVEDGYGRVLSRPGLDVRERELCVVALLAAADWPVQLASHLRGALNVGVEPARVQAALEAGARRADPEAAARARERWRSTSEPEA